MWRSSDVVGYGLNARDGSIGSVADLLFDDRDFAVRWAVADTGSWLTGRRVILPPSALGRPAADRRAFSVDLTMREIEESPGVGTDRPVSRQHETAIYGHYGWTPYWYPGAMVAGGVATMPLMGAVPPAATAPTAAGPGTAPGVEDGGGDPNLRSVQEVTGYYIRGTDDDVGHVEDVLVGDDWRIRYVIVDTRNWWPGRKVLISPEWFHDISWNDRQVRVDLTRERIEASPEYDPSATMDRSYEERLHRHYGYRPDRA